MDDTARLWDIASGKVLRLIKGNDPANHGTFTYSPDGKLVTVDGGKVWWDLSAGGPVDFPAEMQGDRTKFSDDGSLVAISKFMGEPIGIWNVATRKLVNRVGWGAGSMAFSPDNKLLLTAGGDKAQLFEISSGRQLRVYSGHTAAVTDVAFLPGGQRIMTSSMDGTIRTWITDYNDLLAYACTRVGTDLTQNERGVYRITDPEPVCPQFSKPSKALMPVTTPMPARTPPPVWTPMPTPTSGSPKP